MLVALFISRPLLAREGSSSNVVIDQVDHESSFLLAERDRILNALQELDFDFALGKIPEETYRLQRLILVMRGAEVLRRLDSLQTPPEGVNIKTAPVTWNIESTPVRPLIQNGQTQILNPNGSTPYGAIPNGITPGVAITNGETSRRATVRGINVAVALPDDDLEVLLAKRRRARQEKSAGFCSMCGDPVRRLDRFCPKCGARIG